jgi:hypothetical protein
VLIRRLLTLLAGACLGGLLAPAIASAGHFSIVGNTQILFEPDNANDIDQISGIETPTSIRFTRFGGVSVGPGPGCRNAFGDTDTIDCPKTGITRIVLRLGGGDDIAVVSPAITIPVQFDGGPGRDGLFGGGGTDEFDGGPGNDNVVARDGKTERVDCAEDFDTAITDDADQRISCEEIEGDADSDGVRRPADCDDTNPRIRPGVPDIADNGIDEDCSGVDAVNADRDADGFPRPQDCDDTSAAIRPGALEVIGNDSDENCDGRAEPFPPISGTVSATWSTAASRTRNLTLVARKFPARTTIEIRCRGGGCPNGVITRTVRTRTRPVNLHDALGRRRLAAGARLELSFSRPQRIGRVLRYRVNARTAPSLEILCRPPGGAAGPC